MGRTEPVIMQLLAIATGALVLTGCDLFDSKMVSSCEVALKDRLKAPSTYHRIEVTEASEKMSFDDYFSENETSPATRNQQRRYAKEPPVRLIVFIKYEAANAFNVPLRSIAECTYASLDGSQPSRPDFVKINGKSNTEWMVDSVKAATTR